MPLYKPEHLREAERNGFERGYTIGAARGMVDLVAYLKEENAIKLPDDPDVLVTLMCKALGAAEAQVEDDYNAPEGPTQIRVYPNDNADGWDDNWVCPHIGMQTGKSDGETWLCEACNALLDTGNAQVVKVPRAAGAGQ